MSRVQHSHFLLGEEAPVTTLDTLLGETCEHHAVKLANPVAEALEDTAHDAVLTRVNLDAQLCCGQDDLQDRCVRGSSSSQGPSPSYAAEDHPKWSRNPLVC